MVPIKKDYASSSQKHDDKIFVKPNKYTSGWGIFEGFEWNYLLERSYRKSQVSATVI